MLYDPSEIRTGNMLPDRSTDIVFDLEVEPSMTQQQFARECDINNIVKSPAYQPVDPSRLLYADVSEVLEYDKALNIVLKAQDSFSGLPAVVRKRFDNDPSKMIDFLQDANNQQEAISLGLIQNPSAPSSEPEKLTPSPEQVA